MKDIYIFFVLLVYVTLNSFGQSTKTIEITSDFSYETSDYAANSSITDDNSTLYAQESLTSEVANINEFDNNQITSEIIAKSSQSLFIEPSAIDQLLNSIANYDSRLKIRLEFFTSKNYKREILLTIDDRSPDAVDTGFDAILNNDYPNDMYWVLDDEKFVIQAFNVLKEDRVVPIGIKSMGDCSVQIKVSTIENPYPDMEVYLRDNTTMDTYDILNDSFEVALDEGQFNDKYSVVFETKVVIEEETALVVIEEEAEEIQNEIDNTEAINDLRVFVSGNNELLRIKKPVDITLTNIAMFNLLGQQINAWNVNMNTNEIDLPIHVNRGIHLILMDTSKGRLMKKVIIK